MVSESFGILAIMIINTRNYHTVLVASLTLIALTSCATIMGKSAPEILNIRSTPDQAEVIITDETSTKIFVGNTPISLPLEKKRGYFSGKKYNVRIQKEGYEDQIVTVNTKVGGWYIGNFLFGGLIGLLVVDPATGAMWTLDANEVNVTFDVLKQSSIIESGKMSVVLLQDVTASLREKMIRVTP